MNELGELVRGYNEMYSEILECLPEIESADKMFPKSQNDETELLNRISKLEIEKDNTETKFLSIRMQKEDLEQRLKGINVIREESEKNQNLFKKEENKQLKKAKEELDKVKEELEEWKKESERRERERERILEDITQREILLAKDMDRSQKENQAFKKKNEEQSELIGTYQEKVKQMDSIIIEKKNEINKIKSKGNHSHKNYKSMQAIFKTNEVKIRSLENEVKKVSARFTQNEEKVIKSQNALKSLTTNLKFKGVSKMEISAILGEAVVLVDLDDVFEEELSLDTEDEMAANINQNLKDLDKEFEGRDIQLTSKQKKEYEDEISHLEEMNSSIFEAGLTDSGHESEFKLNTAMNAGIDQSSLRRVDSDKDDDDNNKNEQSKNEMFLRNGDSDFEDSSEDSKEEKSLLQYKSDMEKKIEDQINGRSKSPSIRGNPKRLSQFTDKNEAEKSRKPAEALELSGTLRSKLFDKIRRLDPDVFKQIEKEHIEMKIKMMRTTEDLTLWMMQYFEEKVRKTASVTSVLASEKSKFIWLKHILMKIYLVL